MGHKAVDAVFLWGTPSCHTLHWHCPVYFAFKLGSSWMLPVRDCDWWFPLSDILWDILYKMKITFFLAWWDKLSQLHPKTNINRKEIEKEAEEMKKSSLETMTDSASLTHSSATYSFPTITCHSPPLPPLPFRFYTSSITCSFVLTSLISHSLKPAQILFMYMACRQQRKHLSL